MKKTILAAIAYLAVGLTSCTTLPGSTTPTLDPAVIGQIQQDVAAACGIVPTVATIITVFNPGIGAAISAADAAICAAVAAAPPSPKLLASSSALHPVQVGVLPNGVSITGYKARLKLRRHHP